MNQRGITVKFLVGLGIALAIFFMLFVFTGDTYGSITKSVKNIFPNTNVTHAVDEEIFLRYHIPTEEIGWSESGTEWNELYEFTGLEIDGKSLKKENLLKDFEAYYYDEGRQNELPVDIKLSVKANSEFYPTNTAIPFINAEIERFCRERDDLRCNFRKGDLGKYFVRVLLKDYDGKKLTDELPGHDRGGFLVRFDGRIFFREADKSGYDKISKLTDSHKVIIDAVNVWRDSVIDEPIDLEGFKGVETEKLGDYIVIRLEGTR